MAVTIEQLTRALADALAPIHAALAALKGDVVELKGDVAALKGDVVALKGDVAALKGDVAALKGGVVAIEARLAAADAMRANDTARLSNKLRALTSPLAPLPFTHDGAPWPIAVAQPPSLLHLSVSGAETMPGTAFRPTWNRAMSRAFLHAAVAGYTEDGEESEREESNKARVVRLKVIEAVGGVYERVIGAVYVL
jgi:hypothetical protein